MKPLSDQGFFCIQFEMKNLRVQVDEKNGFMYNNFVYMPRI